MRFSDLKKKLPSLRVGVLVIAAFALLGLMMLPSISEKMGLDEGLCVAGYEYYEDECDTEYRNNLQCEMTYEECIADVESSYKALRLLFDMGETWDEETEEALDWMTEAALEQCVEDLDDCLEG